jgi:hypothetical protein
MSFIVKSLETLCVADVSLATHSHDIFFRRPRRQFLLLRVRQRDADNDAQKVDPSHSPEQGHVKNCDGRGKE